MIGISIANRNMIRRAGGGSWWELLSGAVGAWEGALAADQATSYLNLLSPGVYTLSVTGAALSWTAGVGWSGFSTSSSVLYTGIMSSVAGFMVHFAGLSGSSHICVMGCASSLSGNTQYNIWPIWHSPTTNRAYKTQAGSYSAAGAQLAATMAMSGGQAYLNGVADGAPISVGSPTTTPMGIGGGVRRTDAQGGWAFDGLCDGSVKRAIVWTTAPDASQIADIHEAWAAL